MVNLYRQMLNVSKNFTFENQHSKSPPIFVLATLISEVRKKWRDEQCSRCNKPYLMDRIQDIKPLLLFLSLLIILFACGQFWCAFTFFTITVNSYNKQISKKLVTQYQLFTDLKPAVWPNRYRVLIRCTEYVPEWFLSSRMHDN